MKKAFKHTLNLTLLVTMLLSLMIFPTFADVGESSTDTATVYGYSYQFTSFIWNDEEDPGKVGFQTNVGVTNANTVPTGYMGACAKLYSVEAGAVVKDTGMWYTISPEKSTFSSDVYRTSGGYYYSKGAVDLYNGNGYTRFTCSQTPNYAPFTHSLSEDVYTVQRNEKGEIYGSELFLNEIGIQPDLILAENAGGVVGYVRNEDLNATHVTCPEETIVYMQNRAPLSIPMYLSDGETVIGYFEVG